MIAIMKSRKPPAVLGAVPPVVVAVVVVVVVVVAVGSVGPMTGLLLPVLPVDPPLRDELPSWVGDT